MNTALIALLLGSALTPASAWQHNDFAVAQAEDEGQYRVPEGEAPGTVLPEPRDDAPSEDGTDEQPDATAPPPSGCNFQDGRPLELLV